MPYNSPVLGESTAPVTGQDRGGWGELATTRCFLLVQSMAVGGALGMACAQVCGPLHGYGWVEELQI